MVQTPIQPDPIRPTVRSALSKDLGAAKGIVDALRKRRGDGIAPLATALSLYTVSGGLGSLSAYLYDFPDWYMQLAMYLCILFSSMFYTRAHLRLFRVRRIFWALYAAGGAAFFAWTLADLVPARTMITSPALHENGLSLPQLIERPRADWLYVWAIINLLFSLSLLGHLWFLRPKNIGKT